MSEDKKGVLSLEEFKKKIGEDAFANEEELLREYQEYLDNVQYLAE